MNAIEVMVVVFAVGYFGWFVALFLWWDLRKERRARQTVQKLYSDLTLQGRSKR